MFDKYNGLSLYLETSFLKLMIGWPEKIENGWAPRQWKPGAGINFAAVIRSW